MTPERRQRRCSDFFISNFEHILHLALVFLMLTLSRKMPAGMTWLDISGFFQPFILVFEHKKYI